MEAYHLEQMQSLPLEGKIVKSHTRIREWLTSYPDATVALSGLDSAVVLHLVRKIAPNTPAVFCNTGLEYPEVVYWIRTIPNCDVISPKHKPAFSHIVEKYGYPVVSKEQANYLSLYQRKGKCYQKISAKWKFLTKAPFKISAECCQELKKKPFKGYKAPFLGMRAEESRLRWRAYLKNGGCNVFRKRNPHSSPIGFWKHVDVIQYAKQNNITLPSIYGEITPEYKLTGLQRTGCTICLLGIHHEYTPNRIQKLYYSHPGLWRYAMKVGLGKVMEFMEIPYKPEEVDYAEKRAVYERRRREEGL